MTSSSSSSPSSSSSSSPSLVPKFGFIMLRHMNSEQSAKYWAECYTRIRRFYPETPIVIIDDNSGPEYLDAIKDKEAALHNCTIVRTIFHKRGELLPYYCYTMYNWFDNALIIHDSVFINSYIDFETNATSDKMSEHGCIFMWHFGRAAMNDNRTHDIALINKMIRGSELMKVYVSPVLWTAGCFGVMSLIRRSFLLEMNEIYDFSGLIPHITTRQARMALERAFACMVFDVRLRRERRHQSENKNKIIQPQPTVSVSIFGNIHAYCEWGYSYSQYISNYNNYATLLPVIKVWSGR